jgi:hypothetical protein
MRSRTSLAFRLNNRNHPQISERQIMLSSERELPEYRSHPASKASVVWSATRGWCATEHGTGKRTDYYVSEESAIMAARRREWEK